MSVCTERLFSDVDRNTRASGRGTSEKASDERDEKKQTKERRKERWGKKKRSIDRAFLCDVARARARERDARTTDEWGTRNENETKRRQRHTKKEKSLARAMDLDDEDEARLDAMQGDRDAIPSGAYATTTLATMTMTMMRAETNTRTVTRGAEAKKASETMTSRAMTWMERSKASSSSFGRRGWVDARAAARGLARAATRRAREREGSTARFVDLETGVRARYVRKGGSERVVIVLHDVGECAEMHEGLTRALSESGYETYAPDCRGHGGTSASREGRYGVRDLSADVEAFVVALDLYVRPVCLVGFGMGGVVACETARRWPRLVAATVVVECAPTVPPRMYSHCSVQAMVCASVEEVARALASPVFEDDDEPRRCRDVFRRACRRAVTCTTTTTTTGKTRGNENSGVAGDEIVRWRMDPTFYFTYDVDAFRECVETNACHFALVYGERSSLVDHRTASLVVDAASRAAKTSRAYVVPEASRHITDDAFADARDAVLRAVARADDDMLVANKQARTPEGLGIRPLPQYDTLEDALKALAPRAVPTEAAVEAALEDARADDECPSDDDSAARFNNRTKLIQNDPEYFGFVG